MVSHLGKLHYFCAVGCLVEVHGKNRGDGFLLHQAVPLTAIGLLGSKPLAVSQKCWQNCTTFRRVSIVESEE